MSTPELRKKIIAKVRSTKDTRLLREVDHLLKIWLEDQPVYKTTPEQKKAIAKGEADYKRGRFKTAAEADKELRAWLRK